jgi:hypothetical protein
MTLMFIKLCLPLECSELIGLAGLHCWNGKVGAPDRGHNDGAAVKSRHSAHKKYTGKPSKFCLSDQSCKEIHIPEKLNLSIG